MPPLPNPEQNAAFLLAVFLSPLLVSIIKQSGLTTAMNALIAQVVYVVVGVLGAVWSGIPITVENSVPLIVTATLVGSAAYNLIWSKIGGDEHGNGSIDDRLTQATSILR